MTRHPLARGRIKSISENVSEMVLKWFASKIRWKYTGSFQNVLAPVNMSLLELLKKTQGNRRIVNKAK